MKTSPYGSWKSPISSKIVTESGVGLLAVRVDCNPQHTDTVYWTELRYEEEGRYVICSYNKSTKTHQEWTPKGFSARTTVHEYGGGSFFVYNGAVYFSNFTDQILYVQQSADAKPEPVTDTSKKWRYADGVISPKTGVIYCVRENHEVKDAGAKEPENDIVAINLTTKQVTVLAHGFDFYSHPRVSPNGKKICWFQWNHPNMPWDDTELWVAELDDAGTAIKDGTRSMAAGGENESAIEPGWTPNNELLYVSDRTNWWNLYHVTADGTHVNLHPVPTEIAGPQWTFGNTAYVPDPAGSTKILISQEPLEDGKGTLGLVDTAKPGQHVALDTGFRYNKVLALTTDGNAYFIGSGYARFPCIVRFNINTKETEIIKESMHMKIDEGYLSKEPQFIEWKTTGGVTCHGIFYPPANKDFQAPEGTKPPLLVRAHGGPTGHYFANLDLKLQYFTSRGFAVLLVNYRGSTGFGRTYRHMLRKSWGICDVEDCCTGVEHLAREGKVDPDKACIDGEPQLWVASTLVEYVVLVEHHSMLASIRILRRHTHTVRVDHLIARTRDRRHSLLQHTGNGRYLRRELERLARVSVQRLSSEQAWLTLRKGRCHQKQSHNGLRHSVLIIHLGGEFRSVAPQRLVKSLSACFFSC